MTIDWTKSMQRTYEYYTVNPETWLDETKIDLVRSSSVTRDLESISIESASFDIDSMIGEAYIRTYLIATQNGYSEKVPIGTHLVQTPSLKSDGMVTSMTLDGYSVLTELSEKMVPIGFFIKGTKSGTNVYALPQVYHNTYPYMRAPMIHVNSTEGPLLYSDFVAESSDTRLSFANDLLSNVSYRFDISPLGYVSLTKVMSVDEMTPTFEYTDDEISILYPSITLNNDIYGIPNVVEVVYSNDGTFFKAEARNTDYGSPVSIGKRGREITKRITNPNLTVNPSADSISEYAKKLLEQYSKVQYTVSYSHAFHPDVKVGDCVLLNHPIFGDKTIKAYVTYQQIKCGLECEVQEKAVYMEDLWG